ncbi:MAG: RHS repeat domain-containing protein [Flavobacteriales bacterium]
MCISYLVFGMQMPGRKSLVDKMKYGFNGMENDDEIKGYGNSVDFGARMYDPRLGRWFAVDPLAGKFPDLSPYNYSINNPVYLTDPNGKEPIPWWRRWYGNKRKPSQWFATSGFIYDQTTFNSANIHNTQNLNTKAYQGVYQRSRYYGWVQNQISQGQSGSEWFGAAERVIQWDGVGSTELPNLWFMTDKTESFLKRGNEFLFESNIKKAQSLINDGKLSGEFINANGITISFEGKTGIDLDYALVEYEQSLVQEFIDSYEGDDLDAIIQEINSNMNINIADDMVNDVMDEEFNKGKDFDFNCYEDRVKLGQALIDKLHEKDN